MFNYVKQAIAFFKQGDFDQAKKMYQQAANQYGSQLFSHNIRLCELRINRAIIDVTLSNVQSGSAVSSSCSDELFRQLAETQKLLEHYYIKCQDMESQLMDRKIS